MAGMLHEEFFNGFIEYIERQRKDKTEKIDWVEYSPGREIILVPEPITFIGKLDDFADNSNKCREEFKRIMETFPRIKLDKAPQANIWFNTTRDGINLRPGIGDLSSRPDPVTLGDRAVHGLMAGQTGSGKSVMLNNLIFNMLMEYAPWELDLYLADFKRVEFSKYMNNFETPHLSACAATGEIRYVLSLISYLVDCMNAREDFFARMGIEKIAAFRKLYPNAVMPRLMLVVDEFQQMFLEASPKEGERIRQMLTAIVKKGRATGFHLLFASQEMTGTLSQSDLANFRMRFALRCNAGVSQSVLGNSGAKNIRVGTVLVNQEDGSIESNIKYSVPYIETEKKGDMMPYFYDYLGFIKETAEEYGFEKPKKFYKEEQQEPFEKLSGILHKIKDYRRGYFEGNSRRYFDVLTLGSYVVFSNLKHDIQTLFLEYGRNKNILAVSPQIDDLAYIEKLLCENFLTSPRSQCTGVPYKHEIYSFNPLLRSMYALEEIVGEGRCRVNPDDLNELELVFAKKKMLMQLCRECGAPLEFVKANYHYNLMANIRSFSRNNIQEMEETAFAMLEEVFGDIDIKDVPKVCKRVIRGEYDPEIKTTANNLMEYYRYKQNEYFVFPPTIYWIAGVDSVERLPEWFLSMMKSGMDYNILFILIANGEFDELQRAAKTCDYLFVSGNNSRIYDRLHMNFTHKSDGCIALDMQIKSMEEERAFKKYKCSFGKAKAPMIPFDDIL